MARISWTRTVDPAVLHGADRDRFIEELWSVNSRVFDGATREQLLDYVFNPEARWLRVRIFEDSAGRMVGYFATQFLDRSVEGRNVQVFRAQAGILPEYRGRHSTVSVGLVEAARYKLRHPFHEVYYLGMLVHPSSYHLLAKYFPEIHPTRTRGLPESVRRFMVALADSFHESAVSVDRPLIRQVGWITREYPAEFDRSESAMADEAFFVAANPAYMQGHGLVTLVPLTLANLAAAAFRLLARRLTGHRV